MGKTMIETKPIKVNDTEYELSILKNDTNGYSAYLSDVNRPFAKKGDFVDLNDLQNNLRRWIIESNQLNDPELLFFQRLKDWDGVIEV